MGLKEYIQAGAILLSAGVLIVVSSFLKKEPTVQLPPEVMVLRKPPCPSSSDEYEKARLDGQSVTLIKNLATHGANGVLVNKRIVILNRTGIGSEVSCGYLYVKTGTKAAPLNEAENIYIKPGQFGGHIQNSGFIFDRHTWNRTEQLFNLSNIEYKPRLGAETHKADWAALLNVSSRTEFEISLNTVDPTGMVDEITIVYKCWSPETGMVTRDCKLEVIK